MTPLQTHHMAAAAVALAATFPGVDAHFGTMHLAEGWRFAIAVEAVAAKVMAAGGADAVLMPTSGETR